MPNNQPADDSLTAAVMRRDQYEALMREPARDLTQYELGYLLGPRWPTGDRRNYIRGVRIRGLRRRGFTCDGKAL